MSKRGKQRARRGRPQAAAPRKRRHKGPPPRPARKPEPPGFWQRLGRRGSLFWGLSGLVAVAMVLGGVLLGAPRLSRPKATPTPAAFYWTEPPKMAVDVSKSYTATIVTDKGEIVLQLFTDKAPKTVNSFVFLARQGYYDEVTFHRVLPDFMAQTGDRTGTGTGGPGYRFEDEIDPSLQFDSAGILAMANSGPNTNGSQFFITYDQAPWLDGKHTIFGKVVSGMEVLRALTPRNPDERPQFLGDMIRTIQITEG